MPVWASGRKDGLPTNILLLCDAGEKKRKMLNTLRNSAGSWVVKILLGLLIVSFAIWGIGDIFRGGGSQTLAEVGDREVSPELFQRNYRNQIALVGAQLGRDLTAREARAFGIGQSVLQNLISTTAIDIHADSLGVGISDEAVATAIREEPSFEGAGGAFDPARFQEVLRNIGLSEQGFIALQREEMVREQLASALSQGAYVPHTLLDATYHFENDERVLKYFVVKPEAAGEIAAPDDEALKSYYETNKARYMAPEYRKIGTLALTPEAIKDTIAIKDEELTAHFEATKDRYTTPERRTIQQLVFETMEAARQGAEKLANGADFAALGKELGMTDADINLGTFAKSGLADRKLAEAAFALEQGKISQPIDSFSPVIVKVTEITPGVDKSFEQVKDQVRDDLARNRAREELQKLYDAIEDARAGGANVAEAAGKLNLPYAELTLDRNGNGMDGKTVEALSGNRDAINLVFESDAGVENNPISKDEGYLFIDVLEVIPERQKTFEEVRADVTAAWIDEETRKKVRAKAEELVEKTKSGTTIEKLAEEVGADVATTGPLKRGAAPNKLPRTAVSLAFTLAEDGFGHVQMDDRKSQAVIQVAEAKKAPTMDEKQAEALRTDLRQKLSVDILTQYVGGLQKDYGVQVNSEAISALIAQ
jgi:peptidyl-prolyl cis-trans isomerase D